MQDDEYYQITSQLDAREILRYLNDLGIQNISGQVLKNFISDLKKLIKYELQNRDKNSAVQEFDTQWSDRLHSASTFSSRIRSRTQDSTSCNKECQKSSRKKMPGLFNTYPHSAPNLRQLNPDTNLSRRACSCVRVEKKQDLKHKETKDNIVSSNNNLIKVSKQPTNKKCDPVSLYHYYMSLWAKYKPNVPGENNWSDLRWQIRQKMAGSFPKQGPKVPVMKGKNEENS